jgi:hypothetical protein
MNKRFKTYICKYCGRPHREYAMMTLCEELCIKNLENEKPTNQVKNERSKRRTD